MDDPARRFRGLFSCEPADNPFLVIGLPAWICAAAACPVGKERTEALGVSVIADERVPLRDAENLGSGFAVQRHEGQGAVGGAEIDTDAETG